MSAKLNIQCQQLRRDLDAALRRIEALEAHVERLEESAPAPDSHDLRPPLPRLGDE